MCSGSQRFAARGSVEEVNSDLVVRRGSVATGGPRAILRASILPRRLKSFLRTTSAETSKRDWIAL
jgi:hypothetical protein